MRDFMPPASPVSSGLTKLQNLILLNVAFVFTCIPVITIGAAFAALYDTLRSPAYGSQGMGVLEVYWISWKKYFKSATSVWIPVALLCALLVQDFLLIGYMEGNFRYISLGMFLFIGFVIFSVITVAFPLLTRRPERGMKLIRLSVGITACSLSKVIPAMLLKFLPVLVLWFFPTFFVQLFLLWVLLYFSLSERINVLILESVFYP